VRLTKIAFKVDLLLCRIHFIDFTMKKTKLISHAWMFTALLLIGYAITWPVQAQPLEIIELRHRPAEQVIPIVRPMLDRDGAITGTGFQLMVRTSPQNFAQIRQMVASLDRAARQLIIQVRQDRDGREARFDARGNVILSPGASRAAGTVADSTSQGAGAITQQVRTQEGAPAYVSTGTSQLVPQRNVRRTVNGVVVQDTVAERDISSGFYVTPRVNGDNVFLEISTQRDTPNPALGAGGANISRSATSVSGRLGEWIEIGGVNQTSVNEGSGLLSRSSASSSQNTRIYLRVEEAR
jgi:hypothetical protein